MAETIQSLSDQTRSLFGADYGQAVPADPGLLAISYKRKLEYDNVKELPRVLAEKQAQAAATRGPKRPKVQGQGQNAGALVRINGDTSGKANGVNGTTGTSASTSTSTSLVRRPNTIQPKPDWHAPWKLLRVISGHLGWVRTLAVDPDNQYFVSGAGDRTIKIWDLATGNLRLTSTLR